MRRRKKFKENLILQPRILKRPSKTRPKTKRIVTTTTLPPTTKTTSTTTEGPGFFGYTMPNFWPKREPLILCQ